MRRPVYDESLIPAFEEETDIAAKAKSAMLPLAAFAISILLLASFVGFLFWMKERARYEEESLEAAIQEQ